MAKDKSKKNAEENKVNIIKDENTQALESLSRQELVNLAMNLKIKNYSRLSKSELIKLIGQAKTEGLKTSEEYTNSITAETDNYSPPVDITDNIVESEKNIEVNLLSEEAPETEEPETITGWLGHIIPNFVKKIINKFTGPDLIDSTGIDEVVEDEHKSYEQVDLAHLDSLSRQELVEVAKELKVKNYSRLSKSDLLKSINKLMGPEKTDKKVENPVPVVDLADQEKFIAPERGLEEEEIVLDTDKGVEDFEILSRQELVDIAKDLKIKNYSRLSKSRLVKLISEAKSSISPVNKPVPLKDEKPETVKKPVNNEDKPENLSAVEENKQEYKKVSPELNEVEPETIESPIEQSQDDLIEKIAMHLKSPYVDERDASSAAEEELKYKFLLRPSRFPFGATNKEYLLEDEENITLPDLYEENNIVLLPIDPFRVFTYWNLNRETLIQINKMNLQQLVLKVNDVTDIIYDGTNANHYWFESCVPFAKNWYIYLSDGNKNLKVELGYVINGKFNIIAASNTVYVPRRSPSPVIEDRFVIVSYPQQQAELQTQESFLLPSGKTTAYYGFNDQDFSGSYKSRKLKEKMPVFSLQRDIPSHFVREYEISGPSESEQDYSRRLNPPAKLPGSPPDYAFESVPAHLSPATPKQKETVLSTGSTQTQVINSQFVRSTGEIVPQTIIEQFEYFRELPGGKIIVDRFYYEVPGQDQKIIKIFYEWFEEGVPVRKEFYWYSDTEMQIHDKIYKISWGPTWVKEFIGGSEQIKFLGASERFLGGSERFLGGSEMFLGSSGRFIGGSEMYLGENDRFMGASEIFLGGSEKFIGASERHIGGSEQFIGGSEQFLGASEQYIGGSEQFIGASDINLVV